MCGRSVGTGGPAGSLLERAGVGWMELVGCGLTAAGGDADGVLAVLAVLVGFAAWDDFAVQPPSKTPTLIAAAATRRPVDFTASVCRVVAICRAPAQESGFACQRETLSRRTPVVTTDDWRHGADVGRLGDAAWTCRVK
jgi:hypothetical protein